MLAEKIKKDIAEGYFLFLARHDMSHLIHRHAHAVGQTLLER